VYSLKKKLNKSLILNMVVVMLLLLVGLNITIQSLVKEHVLGRLQHDAESLISVVQQNADETWIVNPTHISTVYNRVRSGHYYRITTQNQTIRSRSLFDFEFSSSPINEGHSNSYKMKGPGDESWIVWQQTINKNDQLLKIWVAENIAPFNQSLLRYSFYAVVIVLLALLISLYIQHKILNRAFSVFDALRYNLQLIRQSEADSSDIPVPVEVLPLVDEIKKLVAQLRHRIQRTRRAISNLSHEIKRPLQLLSLHVDAEEDKGSAHQAIHHIRAIVDRELRRAKISGSSSVGSVFRLKDEMPYLLEIMRKIYPTIAIELNTPAELNEINLDKDDLIELLGNLIDNACKFASKNVSIQMKTSPQHFHLSIEDDGAGAGHEQLEKIAGKGVRLDETVEGHGLGLGICLDIIESYKGQLNFSSSDMGGLKVAIEIPLSD
jgi:signal transduction histidine kinase